jgi:hypothetical protein
MTRDSGRSPLCVRDARGSGSDGRDQAGQVAVLGLRADMGPAPGHERGVLSMAVIEDVRPLARGWSARTRSRERQVKVRRQADRLRVVLPRLEGDGLRVLEGGACCARPERAAQVPDAVGATSIGRLTDTLTKCLAQGRGVLHCIAHTRYTHVWTPDFVAAPADILLTLRLEKHQRPPPDNSGIGPDLRFYLGSGGRI